MRTAATCWIVLSGWCGAALADERLFREQVAPIFERHCVGCHSGDNPKGGLSLVDARGALAGGESGAAIEPGDADASLIALYISGDEPQMPKDAPALSQQQVRAVRQWIQQGAAWPADARLADRRFEGQSWWSLEPLSRPAIPQADGADPAEAVAGGWEIRTPIDAFIMKELKRRGLPPSPPADRRTMARRLTFNLHGLPPTPEEIAAFEADEEPAAYERLVDRLLASPRYGERWGRHWLDLVHYGETHGYDKDKVREHAWPYRDWVIASFNSDKPYWRFVEEQLAGDVLYPGDPEALVATGFIAAGPWDFVGHVELREGTTDKEIARSNDRDDMVMTTMSTFLSVTAHCARCHDHKFDPIPQKDYYRLQAVFAGVDRADRPFHSDPRVHRRRLALESRQREIAERQRLLDGEINVLAGGELARLDAEAAALQARLKALEETAGSPSNGYHSAIMGVADEVKWVQVDLGGPRPIEQIELVPARPTDFADTPGFGFPTRFAVEVSSDAEAGNWQTLADETGKDFANPGHEPYVVRAGGRVARHVRVRATRLWPRSNDYVFALAELRVLAAGEGRTSENLALGATVTALDSIEAGRWSTAHLVDGFDSRGALDPDGTTGREAARRALEAQLERARQEHGERLLALVDEATRSELAEVRREAAEVAVELAALPPVEWVYAAAGAFAGQVNFTAAGGCRPIYFLHRGSVSQPGELMPPGALSCLEGLAHHFDIERPEIEGNRRAALARWIVDPGNPLAARSIVNRVWQYHFGQGLVETPNDFGRMGSRPTHGELLDWLACELRANGGSIKQLNRLILNSSVYRQSSRQHELGRRIDAGNRYLWRMNRARLDAESVRDAVLAVSGTLDSTMGGPSARQFLFKDDHSPVYDYEQFDVESPASFRRGIYRFIVRSVPDPFMDCLDAADPSILTPQRNTTLTALQALAMLNNPLLISQSEHFSQRLKRHSGDTAEQIRRAWLLALGRPPSEDEAAGFAAYARRHGLASACRLVFNSNEFLFVD